MPPRHVRVIDLETGGNAPHEVCEIGWQDVAQGPDGRWALDDAGRGAMLIHPGGPISVQTMAIHHIRDIDVAGAPFWKDAAPNVLRGDGAVALAAHRASFEQRYCTPRLSGGAKWVCTWKCALRLWPHLQSFSNQMLRYQRDPQGLDHQTGLPAHRAFPDAYVTAHHLRDMLNEASLEQLLEWSALPGLLPRVPAGPERGKAWADLPFETLTLLAKERDLDVRYSAQTELRRRGDLPEPAATEKPPTLL